MTGWLSRAPPKGCWSFSVAFRHLVSGHIMSLFIFISGASFLPVPSLLWQLFSLTPAIDRLPLPFCPLAVAWTVPAFEISRSGNPLIRAPRWDYHRGQLWLLPHPPLPSLLPPPLAIPAFDLHSNQIPFKAGRIRKLAALFHGTKTEQD